MIARARTSVRWRLTLLYGGMFFLAGAVLVVTGYVLVRHALVAGISDLNGPLLTDLNRLPDSKPFLTDAQGSVTKKVGEYKSELLARQQALLDSALRRLLLSSLLATATVGLVSAGAGWVMAGRVIRPLHRITGTAREVAARNLGERIRLNGPDDEFKDLADTFDAMLERLDTAFDGQRRFVANASHELRTPLTVSRTLIQVALERPDCSDDVRRLGTALLDINTQQRDLTNGLLMLARSEQAVSNAVPVDLGSTAARVVHDLADEAAAADVATGVDGAAVAQGDPVLLELLVRNLLLNGIRHNHRGGSLRLALGHEGGDALLEVSNTGSRVLSTAEAEAIFEPFRRLDAERTSEGTGVGLGLSIVRSITTAHRGRVTALARDGGGLVVRVHLPAGHGAVIAYRQPT